MPYFIRQIYMYMYVVKIVAQRKFGYINMNVTDPRMQYLLLFIVEMGRKHLCHIFCEKY